MGLDGKKNNIPARQKDNRKTWGEKNQSANVNTTKLGNSKPSVAAAASSLRFEFFFFFLILVFFFQLPTTDAMQGISSICTHATVYFPAAAR